MDKETQTDEPADDGGPVIELEPMSYTRLAMYAQLASWAEADYNRLLLGQQPCEVSDA